jgi:hypothetical protein
MKDSQLIDKKDNQATHEKRRLSVSRAPAKYLEPAGFDDTTRQNPRTGIYAERAPCCYAAEYYLQSGYKARKIGTN